MFLATIDPHPRVAILLFDPRGASEARGNRTGNRTPAPGHRLPGLNVDPGTLRRWEKGEREPSGKHLSAVLGFLGRPDRRAPATTLIERLKRYREDRGLSHQQLAKNLAIRRTTLASWEAGQNKPKAETVA